MLLFCEEISIFSELFVPVLLTGEFCPKSGPGNGGLYNFKSCNAKK